MLRSGHSDEVLYHGKWDLLTPTSRNTEVSLEAIVI
jgi:hypothetical protein